MTTSVIPDTAFSGTAFPQTAPAGLKGLIVADTTVGSVRGDAGYYHYRQYNAVDLARTQSLEAVWFLLHRGTDAEGRRLPSPEEEAAIGKEIGEARVLEPDLLALIEDLAHRVTAPHLLLQAALPLVLPDAPPTLDQSPSDRAEAVHRIMAVVPVILGAGLAARQGRRPLQADPALGHAADWYRLATGCSPTPAQTRAVEAYLIATVDHGFNASTFATRVVTSTGADVVSALSSGVAALSGPLHGGAPARALAMIEAIGPASSARVWVSDRLASGGKIMGFGHAVYRADDPRSTLMRSVAEQLASGPAEVELVERAIAIEAEVLAALRAAKPGAVIVTNVEYYAGVVLHLAGLPAEAFTPSFTVSRVLGWGAHLLEQAADNKIMRPSSRYVGPEPITLDEDSLNP